ncbi:MAG: dihydroorotate dehydrogenase electron transfer subunit [Planctomycetes bacterium]|nr:dihydroorotate dehydrogenase electron transfer subunit [Planctomycetota bacterium]
MIEQPVMVKICDILEESPGVKTFFFKLNLNFEPGQFVMVWIPLLDEKPFALSYVQDGLIGISVLKRGVFTNVFHRKKIGDMVGIRGPYGRGFSLKPDFNSCIVGGGIGMACLASLVDRLNLTAEKHQGNATVIQGARTAAEILYQKRFGNMKLCTDDGTVGFKGTAVDLLRDSLIKQRFQKVYACGPERMLFKVAGLCKEHGIECELSLERYMKCGFGVCGQCDCSGQRVCVDGPVFNGEELSRMEDFGKIIITKTGKRIIYKPKSILN